MTGYIDYENLNVELQDMIDNVNAIRISEADFVNTSIPRSGLFIVKHDNVTNYLPTRDDYALLGIVEEIKDATTGEDFYVRTSFAMRITLGDDDFHCGLLMQ